MDIVRVFESKRLLVIAREEADALAGDRLEYFKKFLEASVGKIVKAWEEPGVHRLEIEPFVGDVDVLRIISHAYPDRAVVFFHISDGCTKRIQVAGSCTYVDISDGVESPMIAAR